MDRRAGNRHAPLAALDCSHGSWFIYSALRVLQRRGCRRRLVRVDIERGSGMKFALCLALLLAVNLAVADEEEKKEATGLVVTVQNSPIKEPFASFLVEVAGGGPLPSTAAQAT